MKRLQSLTFCELSSSVILTFSTEQNVFIWNSPDTLEEKILILELPMPSSVYFEYQ